jgi:hypothetical protein
LCGEPVHHRKGGDPEERGRRWLRSLCAQKNCNFGPVRLLELLERFERLEPAWEEEFQASVKLPATFASQFGDHTLLTMHPTLLIGQYDWQPERLPKSEFLARIQALWKKISDPTCSAVIVYGDNRNHAELA